MTKTKPKPYNYARDYARLVMKKEIVAGPHVRNACRRFLADIKRKDIYFDLAAADRAVRFIETKLKLSEGQFEKKPFKLELVQKFIVMNIFGFFKLNGKRRFRRAYLEIGKGNGKSPLAGAIGLYGLMADNEPGAEIYSAASNLQQAEILFKDACKMVRKSPDIERRVHISGSVGAETNIAYLRKGSFFRPVSKGFATSGAGPRPHMALADEIHEMKNRKTLEQLERGFKFRRNPLLLMITNSGSDRASICWEEHIHAVKVAAGNEDATDEDPHYIGDIIDDSTFSFVCGLDPDDDPLEDPSCWIKANPLLGVILDHDYMADIVNQANTKPGSLNGILRLHFCQWTDAVKAWMPRKTLSPVLQKYDPKSFRFRDIHSGKRAYIGLDLSQSKDLTAKALVVPTGMKKIVSEDKNGKKVERMRPTFDGWIDAWTPRDTMDARVIRDNKPYRKWYDEGYLIAKPGKRIPYFDVAQAVGDDLRDYDLQTIAYDRYAFERFEDEMKELGLSCDVIEHPQGGIKKGKPNQAMIDYILAQGKEESEAKGLWMPKSVQLLEELIAEKRIRLFANPVLLSAVASAVPYTDRWGNYWLDKETSLNKIDAVIALCMAVGAAIALEKTLSGGVDDWLESFEE